MSIEFYDKSDERLKGVVWTGLNGILFKLNMFEIIGKGAC